MKIRCKGNTFFSNDQTFSERNRYFSEYNPKKSLLFRNRAFIAHIPQISTKRTGVEFPPRLSLRIAKL